MGCGNDSANHFQPRLLNPGQGFRCGEAPISGSNLELVDWPPFPRV